MLPARVRYTAVGLGFALCSAVFGGTAPFLATWWVSELGAQWLLIVYTMLAGAITLVVVATIPETRPGQPARVRTGPRTFDPAPERAREEFS